MILNECEEPACQCSAVCSTSTTTILRPAFLFAQLITVGMATYSGAGGFVKDSP